jgi:hypothetical protein
MQFLAAGFQLLLDPTQKFTSLWHEEGCGTDVIRGLLALPCSKPSTGCISQRQISGLTDPAKQ